MRITSNAATPEQAIKDVLEVLKVAMNTERIATVNNLSLSGKVMHRYTLTVLHDLQETISGIRFVDGVR